MYQVVQGIKEDRSEAQAQLENAVNVALSEGWICAGGVSFTVLGAFPAKPYLFAYSQAMVKNPAQKTG